MHQEVTILNRPVWVSGSPNSCPICNTRIEPINVDTANWVEDDKGMNLAKFEVVFKCPASECGRLFISRFEQTSEGPGSKCTDYTFQGSFPCERVINNFNTTIKELSPSYCDIYSQAQHAEKLGLDQICGVGYRKALEHLVKDFCIFSNEAKEEAIKVKLLGQCINEFISDENIKECAKRAAWIGNDEAHYVRKWEDKDIHDLKALIALVEHWITSHLLTKQYLNEMS
ncbi:DUF4145 domain-containing protein [Pseudoalteromonas sp. SG43-7]|uniref:DUF4145 domain-containing protein n=1 Tax=unclassified Pseudoalteromonas TaxID=194690 RepID=UPI0016042F62|nr:MULTISPECIES: DUF4145 domain-containing protein [unclassified Pseudoalteromonas]MBB1294514.1 DUF4145 domain-containing protein [Pseudoalteromonas sp. SR41-4]MBB1420316.1 DUF4145 domain-containing protein [Pseudoalteromonas sp. SG43-7]